MPKIECLLLESLGAAALVLLTGPLAQAQQQTAPCSVIHSSSGPIYIADNAFWDCAEIIQASRSAPGAVAMGIWGGNHVQVDAQSTVYVNGQQYGTLVNPSGTVGSLSDRCSRGDQQACAQLNQQQESAQERYDRWLRSRQSP